MATGLSYGKFALSPNADTNDIARPGAIQFEYVQVNVTIATNTGDVEIPTTLGEVLGFVPLSFSSVFAAGDSVNSYTTDGVVTSGAVTVRVTTTSIADGTLTIRGFLVGTDASTRITLS